MPQLQHRGIIINLHQGHRILTKFILSISSIYTFTELLLAEISEILQEHIHRSLGIGLISHGLNITGAHGGNALGHKQATIISQATGYGMS